MYALLFGEHLPVFVETLRFVLSSGSLELLVVAMISDILRAREILTL
jgi:hypothetical protein